MEIYQAGYRDETEYREPYTDLGIYSDLEVAKKQAIHSTIYLDQIPYVDVLLLKVSEYVWIGTWRLNKKDKIWIYEVVENEG